MSGEIIAIVAVGVALAGVIFAWKTSQKNGELSVEMEKRTREHRAFANRFSVITDVEAEAQSAQEKLATVKATHSAFVNQCQEERTGLEGQYRAASHIYEELKSETVLLEENLEDISFGLYEPHFEFDTAEDYKVELRATRDRQRKLYALVGPLILLVHGLSMIATRKARRWKGNIPLKPKLAIEPVMSSVGE